MVRRAFLIVAIVSVAPSDAFAWGNVRTHEKLADLAAERANEQGVLDTYLLLAAHHDQRSAPASPAH